MSQALSWPTPQDIRDGQSSVQLCQKARIVETLARGLSGVKLRTDRAVVVALTREYIDEVETRTQLSPISFRARRKGGEQAQVLFPEMQRFSVSVEFEGALAGQMQIVKGFVDISATAVVIGQQGYMLGQPITVYCFYCGPDRFMQEGAAFV
jgi:hypothetical protein